MSSEIETATFRNVTRVGDILYISNILYLHIYFLQYIIYISTYIIYMYRYVSIPLISARKFDV
jgi:hypothetical protein